MPKILDFCGRKIQKMPIGFRLPKRGSPKEGQNDAEQSQSAAQEDH